MRNWLSQWRRNWRAIDTIGVGGGGGLTLWFYLSHARGSMADEAAAIDALWANVGTEILGVWVSVRIIDAIVRSRDQLVSLRQGVAVDLQRVLEHAYDVLAGEVEALAQFEQAIASFDAANHDRQKVLSEDELRLIEKTIVPARRLWQLGYDLLNLYRVTQAQLQKLPDDMFVEIRAELQDAMPMSWENVYVLKRLVQAAGPQQPPSAAEVVGSLRQLVNVAGPVQTHTERGQPLGSARAICSDASVGHPLPNFGVKLMRPGFGSAAELPASSPE